MGEGETGRASIAAGPFRVALQRRPVFRERGECSRPDAVSRAFINLHDARGLTDRESYVLNVDGRRSITE